MWKPIKGYPNYEVSSSGEVKNTKFNRKIAYSFASRSLTKYARVTLFKNNTRHYKQVHRLVAEAFIPNPSNLPQVDHIDGNGLNNTADNLRWVSASENIKYSFKLNPEIKKSICSSGGKEGGRINSDKAHLRLKDVLGDRLLQFFRGGELNLNACVTYLCECGVKRTASIAWKELRVHNGKCPKCTNTVNKSSESILCH